MELWRGWRSAMINAITIVEIDWSKPGTFKSVNCPVSIVSVKFHVRSLFLSSFATIFLCQQKTFALDRASSLTGLFLHRSLARRSRCRCTVQKRFYGVSTFNAWTSLFLNGNTELVSGNKNLMAYSNRVVLANGSTRLQLDIVKSSRIEFHALFSSQLLGLTKVCGYSSSISNFQLHSVSSIVLTNSIHVAWSCNLSQSARALASLTVRKRHGRSSRIWSTSSQKCVCVLCCIWILRFSKN